MLEVLILRMSNFFHFAQFRFLNLQFFGKWITAPTVVSTCLNLEQAIFDLCFCFSAFLQIPGKRRAETGQGRLRGQEQAAAGRDAKVLPESHRLLPAQL